MAARIPRGTAPTTRNRIAAWCLLCVSLFAIGAATYLLWFDHDPSDSRLVALGMFIVGVSGIAGSLVRLRLVYLRVGR